MNHKKKSIILSIFFILFIQILLLISNRQKTSFRYFIWKIEEISIGRLICASFFSGLLMSSILNKTLNNESITYPKNKDNETAFENDYSIDSEDNIDKNESYEIPPERDLRDTQPTISVNYRVIKNSGQKEFRDSNQELEKGQYQDDWLNNDSDW